MSNSGGLFDKIGNRYEVRWTVRCLIDILSGEASKIRLEPFDERGEGVEFWLTRGDTTEYHQVKRQRSSTGRWNIADLDSEGVIYHFWKKLSLPRTKCIFVSTHSALQLEKLTNDARRAMSWKEFDNQLMQIEERKSAFEQLKERLEKHTLYTSDEDIYEKLKLIQVETSGEQHLVSTIHTLLRGSVEGESDKVYASLFSLVWERVDVTPELSESDLWSYLEKVGYSRKEIAPSLVQYLHSVINDLSQEAGVAEYVEPESYLAPFQSKPWDPEITLFVAKAENDNLVEQSIANVRDALNQKNSFVVLGNPGAGKTTTLYRLALEDALACLENAKLSPKAPVPLFLRLSSWDSDSIEEYIRSKWTGEDDPVKLLAQGRLRLYLDGLNEMGDEGKAKAQQLKRFLQGNDNHNQRIIGALKPQSVIVACRLSDYGGFLDLGLSVVRIEELDEDRVRKFAENYLGEKATGFLNSVLPTQQIVNRGIDERHLFNLVRNPYLLRIMTEIYDNSPDGRLPRNTGALFQKLVQLLWEREKIRQTIPSKQFEAIQQSMQKSLARLAFASIDSGMPTYVSKEYALLFIDDPDYLRIGDSASFLKIEGNYVSFYHQLMQEYFAALALREVGVSHIRLNAKSTSSNSGNLFSLFFEPKDFRFSTQWDQVIVALSGIVSQPGEVVSSVARINPFLARTCIYSGVEVTFEKIQTSLFEALLSQERNIRGGAAIVLGESKLVSAIPYLSRILEDKEINVAQAAVDALVSIGKPSLQPLLDILKLQDKPEVTKNRAANIITKIGLPAVPMLLKELANPDIRQNIVLMLGEISATEAFQSLVNIVQDLNEDEKVRADAARALGKLENVDASTILIDALHDDSSYVRVASAEALGKLKILEAIPVLANIFMDEAWHIHNAVYEAFENMKNRKASRYLTKYRALKTQDYKKRKLAIVNLKNEYGVIGLLHALRHRYNDYGVYYAIAEELLKGLDIFPSIMTDAMTDTKDYRGHRVRGMIAYAIGKSGNNKFGDYLLHLLSDVDAFVRGLALKAVSDLKYEQATSAVIKLLDDTKTIYNNTDERVCDAAADTLKELGTPEALSALNNWIKPPKEEDALKANRRKSFRDLD